ncbi:MAG: hypothetical protein IJB31_02710 [Akkermansia sp.]|nr:hypothetical protein [Akkermansia sp.]
MSFLCEGGGGASAACLIGECVADTAEWLMGAWWGMCGSGACEDAPPIHNAGG